MQFLSTKPRKPCIWWFTAPFCRNNLISFSFDVQFCIGLSSNIFFQMCSACQVIQTALSDEFVFNIYRFITLCATGSFFPQEPLDLLHLGKCWDLVLIPENWHEEEPHLWVTSSWDLPGFISLARCLGLYGLRSLPDSSPAISRPGGSTIWPRIDAGHRPAAA